MSKRNDQSATTEQAKIAGALDGDSNTYESAGVDHVADPGFSKGETSGQRRGVDVISGN